MKFVKQEIMIGSPFFFFADQQAFTFGVDFVREVDAINNCCRYNSRWDNTEDAKTAFSSYDEIVELVMRILCISEIPHIVILKENIDDIYKQWFKK